MPCETFQINLDEDELGSMVKVEFVSQRPR